MKTITHRLRRAATAVGVASSVTLLMPGSAHAGWDHPQYTYCDFGQYGYATWHQPYDIDTITNVNGLWRDRNNKLVKGPTTSFSWDGPGYASFYGQGDNHWALYGIILEAGEYVTDEGKGCRNSANIALEIMRDLPVDLDDVPVIGDTHVGTGAVPAPPVIGVSTGPVSLS